jgi:phosphonate transport system substrate-binding protein
MRVEMLQFHLRKAQFAIVLIGVFFLLALPAKAVGPIRIGLTPTFLNERHALMGDWQAYLERKLKRPVTFVLRDSYQETMELLHQQHIDVAWLCDCPHVTANPEFRLLVTPLFQGRPYYRAYLIVPETDKATRGIFDLKEKVFAFTDPYSNVGYLLPRYEIKKSGVDPEHFFRRTFFTRSQRKAIEAVAVGIADGASVNSYIWETINHQAPALTGRTRVVARSQEYGFPPFVADHTFPVKDSLMLQQALIEMSGDVRGKKVLEKMNLTGFVLPPPNIYRDVQEVVRFMQSN